MCVNYDLPLELKIIMQRDVTRCIICKSNKPEYLDKERSYKNSTKEAIL